MDFKQSHETENPREAGTGAELYQQPLQRHVRNTVPQPVARALNVEPGFAVHDDLIGIGYALTVDRRQETGRRTRRFRLKRMRKEPAESAVFARKGQRRHVTRLSARQGHEQVLAQPRHLAVLRDNAFVVAPGPEQKLRFLSRQSIFDQREGKGLNKSVVAHGRLRRDWISVEILSEWLQHRCHILPLPPTGNVRRRSAGLSGRDRTDRSNGNPAETDSRILLQFQIFPGIRAALWCIDLRSSLPPCHRMSFFVLPFRQFLA
ncbi:hypothetical protein [Roseibium aggregatum]|uniref:hypothetical protein n=1 Tax=Roseibium aggregatum TaxID=187304 RepID=UPI0012F4C72E|nr:hypothetical protein [Roseibium aggregatum]